MTDSSQTYPVDSHGRPFIIHLGDTLWVTSPESELSPFMPSISPEESRQLHAYWDSVYAATEHTASAIDNPNSSKPSVGGVVVSLILIGVFLYLLAAAWEDTQNAIARKKHGTPVPTPKPEPTPAPIIIEKHIHPTRHIHHIYHEGEEVIVTED